MSIVGLHGGNIIGLGLIVMLALMVASVACIALLLF